MRDASVHLVRVGHDLPIRARAGARDRVDDLLQVVAGRDNGPEIEPAAGDEADDVGEIGVAAVALRADELAAAYLVRLQVYRHLLRRSAHQRDHCISATVTGVPGLR